MSNENKLLESFGKNLRKCRLKAGFTQEKLAAECDFDPTYISLLERGKRNPPFLSIAKLAKKLKCKVSDIKDISL